MKERLKKAAPLLLFGTGCVAVGAVWGINYTLMAQIARAKKSGDMVITLSPHLFNMLKSNEGLKFVGTQAGDLVLKSL